MEDISDMTLQQLLPRRKQLNGQFEQRLFNANLDANAVCPGRLP